MKRVAALEPEVRAFASQLTDAVARFSGDPTPAAGDELAAWIEEWSRQFDAEIEALVAAVGRGRGEDPVRIRAFVEAELRRLSQQILLSRATFAPAGGSRSLHAAPRFVASTPQTVEGAMVAAIAQLLDVLDSLPSAAGREGVRKAILAIRRVGARFDATPPTVHILAPAQGAILAAVSDVRFEAQDSLSLLDPATLSLAASVHGPVTFVDSDLTGSVAVESFDAVENRLCAIAAGIPDDALEDGFVTFLAGARDTAGSAGSALVDVTLDRTPPVLSVESPTPGEEVAGLVVVSARITDEVSGVEEGSVDARVDGLSRVGELVVTIEGQEVSLLGGLVVAPGPHFLELVAGDRAGNVATLAISFLAVVEEIGIVPIVEIMGGDGQVGLTNRLAREPLIVRVPDAATGAPLKGITVLYHVESSDGYPARLELDDGVTDGGGIASMGYVFGRDPELNVVKVFITGEEDAVRFQLDGRPARLDLLNPPPGGGGGIGLDSGIGIGGGGGGGGEIAPVSDYPGSALPLVFRMSAVDPFEEPLVGERVRPVILDDVGDEVEPSRVGRWYPPEQLTDETGGAAFAFAISAQPELQGFRVVFRLRDFRMAPYEPVATPEVPVTILRKTIPFNIHSGQGQIVLPGALAERELAVANGVEVVAGEGEALTVFGTEPGEGTLLPAGGEFTPLSYDAEGNVVSAAVRTGLGSVATVRFRKGAQRGPSLVGVMPVKTGMWLDTFVVGAPELRIGRETDLAAGEPGDPFVLSALVQNAGGRLEQYDENLFVVELRTSDGAGGDPVLLRALSVDRETVRPDPAEDIAPRELEVSLQFLGKDERYALYRSERISTTALIRGYIGSQQPSGGPLIEADAFVRAEHPQAVQQAPQSDPASREFWMALGGQAEPSILPAGSRGGPGGLVRFPGVVTEDQSIEATPTYENVVNPVTGAAFPRAAEFVLYEDYTGGRMMILPGVSAPDGSVFQVHIRFAASDGWTGRVLPIWVIIPPQELIGAMYGEAEGEIAKEMAQRAISERTRILGGGSYALVPDPISRLDLSPSVFGITWALKNRWLINAPGQFGAASNTWRDLVLARGQVDGAWREDAQGRRLFDLAQRYDTMPDRAIYMRILEACATAYDPRTRGEGDREQPGFRMDPTKEDGDQFRPTQGYLSRTDLGGNGAVAWWTPNDSTVAYLRQDLAGPARGPLPARPRQNAPSFLTILRQVELFPNVPKFPFVRQIPVETDLRLLDRGNLAIRERP